VASGSGVEQRVQNFHKLARVYRLLEINVGHGLGGLEGLGYESGNDDDGHGRLRLRRFHNGAAAVSPQSPVGDYSIESDALNLANRILGRNAGYDFITSLFQNVSFERKDVWIVIHA